MLIVYQEDQKLEKGRKIIYKEIKEVNYLPGKVPRENNSLKTRFGLIGIRLIYEHAF